LPELNLIAKREKKQLTELDYKRCTETLPVVCLVYVQDNSNCKTQFWSY